MLLCRLMQTRQFISSRTLVMRVLVLLILMWPAFSFGAAPAAELLANELRFEANKGDAKAQFNLASMYANGEGIPEDDK